MARSPESAPAMPISWADQSRYATARPGSGRISPRRKQLGPKMNRELLGWLRPSSARNGDRSATVPPVPTDRQFVQPQFRERHLQFVERGDRREPPRRLRNASSDRSSAPDSSRGHGRPLRISQSVNRAVENVHSPSVSISGSDRSRSTASGISSSRVRVRGGSRSSSHKPPRVVGRIAPRFGIHSRSDAEHRNCRASVRAVVSSPGHVENRVPRPPSDSVLRPIAPSPAALRRGRPAIRGRSPVPVATGRRHRRQPVGGRVVPRPPSRTPPPPFGPPVEGPRVGGDVYSEIPIDGPRQPRLDRRPMVVRRSASVSSTRGASRSLPCGPTPPCSGPATEARGRSIRRPSRRGAGLSPARPLRSSRAARAVRSP